MYYQVIKLKEYFPALGEAGRDPSVTVYLPDNLAEMGRSDWKRPCMIVCPGGGYHFCSSREAEPIALNFLPEGYNVFVLRYSVAPHRFPCQLREVAAVLELIYRNADSWHCDTNRIAIAGFSAGGHLAAHYSTSYDHPQVREMFPESKPVQASVLCYPVISADPAISHKGSFQNLLGVQAPTAEQIEQFSCDRLVTNATPPAFLWHTAADQTVPVANSLCYGLALTAHKVPVCMHIYPAGWHGLATADLQTNQDVPKDVSYAADWIDAAKKWLRITLK